MRRNTADDFWTKVSKEKGCWIWTKSKDGDGYGLFSFANKTVRATRFLLGTILGVDLRGKEVLHSCDNPSCVNPDHLLVGTTADNAKDREAKGRGVKGRKQSEEHKAKKAASRRGKKWTQEMRDRMSRIKRGLPA